MDKYRTSGFIGLAPKSSNDEGLQTLPQQIEAGGDPKHKIRSLFGIYMTRNFLYSGAITFSGIDMKYAEAGKNEADIIWYPLAQDRKYWEIDAEQFVFKLG